jgi:hypothetical protein
MSVMQDLYHSEINCSVSTFWDGGFEIKLGDHMSGVKAETVVDRWGQVEPWLTEQVIKHFPDSLFARMYRDGEHAFLMTNNLLAKNVADRRQDAA